MSQKLSVVIPTLNAQQVLPSTLESLMEGVFAGVIGDLVIVDGGSSDATNTIAKEVGATLLETKPSRGGADFRRCSCMQMRLGSDPACRLAFISRMGGIDPSGTRSRTRLLF